MPPMFGAFNPFPAMTALGFEAQAMEATPGIMSVTNGNGISGGGGGNPPGEAQMDAAYSVAGVIVREQLSADQLRVLGQVQDRDVLVVSGCYDHIGRTLDAGKIPYIERAPEAVTPDLLRATRIVFANCGGSFPEDVARHIGKFVEAGGLLLSTDYMLAYLIEKAFQDDRGQPLYIRHNGQRTPNAVVDVDQVKMEDPMMQGFFQDPTKPRWWLEGSSFPIRVVDTQRVEVLARSTEVGTRWGDDPIIVRFAHGKGGVIHLLSHLYLQQGGAKAGQIDESAVKYTTSLGTSMGTINAVKEATARTGEVGAARMRSAVSSVGFVARTVTSTFLGNHPFGTSQRQAGTAQAGANTIGAMMGAVPRSPIEEGKVDPQQLPWEPPQVAYALNRATGGWDPVASPFAWDASRGLYCLTLPEPNTAIFLGRDQGSADEESRRRMKEILKPLLENNPELRLIRVRLRDKRQVSPVSRSHALILSLGENVFSIRGLDGHVGVLPTDDPAEDRFLQAGRDESTFLDDDNRVKLTPEVVFLVRRRA